MGIYTQTGPFTNGSAPGISATFLNNIENWIRQTEADTGSVVVTGSVSGTATLWQIFQGPVKIAIVWMTNFKDAATRTLALPVAFAHGASVWTGGIGVSGTGGMYLTSGGVTQSQVIFTGLAAAGGAITSQNNIYQYSMSELITGFDSINLLTAGAGGAHTAHIILIGS